MTPSIASRGGINPVRYISQPSRMPLTPTQNPGPNRNVQSWIATRVSPAMPSEVPSAPMDAARLSRRVTTESRLIAPTPMIVASIVREAT